MPRDLIYAIRENGELYQYLKYNSYLYKKILRNEISLKELENIMKKDLKLTIADKLENVSNKMELANNLLNIIRQ